MKTAVLSKNGKYFIILIITVFTLILVWSLLQLQSRENLKPMNGNLLYGFIMPHPPAAIWNVGNINTLRAYKTENAMSYVAKQISLANPDTIILITPHAVFNHEKFSVYTDQNIAGSLEKFGFNNIALSLENDTDFIKQLKNNLKPSGLELNEIPEGSSLDHGSFVPVYFINKAGYKGKYVVLNYSGRSRSDHVEFGKIIRKTIENSDKKYVFIASGDMSHKLSVIAPYGYSSQGKVFDDIIVNAIKTGNYESILQTNQTVVKEAAQCGYNSILVALGIIGLQPAQNEVFSYESPFGVGYIVASL